jgi:hypothetical protein
MGAHCKVNKNASILILEFKHSIGITGGFGGDRRVEYIIPADACKRGYHEFVIESSCNGMFGVPWSGDIIAPPDVSRFPWCLPRACLKLSP